MNVYAYLRVSTDKQADRGYSLPEQEERVKAYCKSKEWDLIKIYKDPGFTGSNMERPALQEMINEIDGCDIVLVNKLDRLSRSQKDTLYLIQDVFAPHGASFVSIEESFDTTTALGIAMVGILAAFAQLERSQIKERTKMGKEARKKKGLWHGGINIPIGYDYKDGILVPNDESVQVKQIFDMYLEGTSIRDITRFLQANYTTRYTSWNYVGTVRRILENEVYIGMIDEYKGQHKPIIDIETFEKVQSMLAERKHGGKATQNASHLLTGMIFCDYCGCRVRSCTSVTKKARYGYYRCGSKDTSQLNKLDSKCKLKPQKENEIDEIIKNEILKLKFKDIKLKSETKNLPDNSKEIEKIDKQVKRLIDLYAICGDDVEELAKKIKDLKAKKKSLEKVNIRPKKNSKKVILHTLSIAKETFENGTIDDKRKIVDALISRIDLSNDTVKITWKFS